MQHCFESPVVTDVPYKGKKKGILHKYKDAYVRTPTAGELTIHPIRLVYKISNGMPAPKKMPKNDQCRCAMEGKEYVAEQAKRQ